MRKLRQDEFEKILKERLEQIPEKFRRMLDNVALVIEEEPTREQRKTAGLRRDETLFGLYEGIPRTKRTSGYSGVLPDKITIFRRPILEEAKTPEDVKKIVRDTVWHEIAHHFGLGEEDILGHR